jgi:nicotinate-nucleotide adenylyltransferase
MGIKPSHCELVLGGSFDPVHDAHVAMAKHIVELLQPDTLRIIPAGQPWQKKPLAANAMHRVNMLKLAFAEGFHLPITIDQQEIQRATQGIASYTIDTLRQLRSELGAKASIVWLIGADQLQNLASWKEWRALLDVAHLCVVSRPNYQLNEAHLNPEVRQMWQDHQADLASVKNQAAGVCYWSNDLAWDISATQLRAQLKQDTLPSIDSQNTVPPKQLLTPTKVLDYIQQHHLYQ